MQHFLCLALSLKSSQAAESEQRTHSCCSSSLLWLWGRSLLFIFTLLLLLISFPSTQTKKKSTLPQNKQTNKTFITHLWPYAQSCTLLLEMHRSSYQAPELDNFQRSQSWQMTGWSASHMSGHEPVLATCARTRMLQRCGSSSLWVKTQSLQKLNLEGRKCL